MELDHFRPLSRFPDLGSDCVNVYYSCNPCNGFKWRHWPSSEMEAKGFGFVDPCRDDVSSHYELLADGTLIPLTSEARYSIETCLLNCEHLHKIRTRLKTTGEFAI